MFGCVSQKNPCMLERQHKKPSSTVWYVLKCGTNIYSRGVKLIFTNGHRSIMVALNGPVVKNVNVSWLTFH